MYETCLRQKSAYHSRVRQGKRHCVVNAKFNAEEGSPELLGRGAKRRKGLDGEAVEKLLSQGVGWGESALPAVAAATPAGLNFLS